MLALLDQGYVGVKMEIGWQYRRADVARVGAVCKALSERQSEMGPHDRAHLGAEVR